MSPSASGSHDGSARRTVTGERRGSVPVAKRDEVDVSPAELAQVLRNVAERLDAILDARPRSTGRAGGHEAQRESTAAGGTDGPSTAESGPRLPTREGTEGIDTLVLRLSQERAKAAADSASEVGAVIDPERDDPAKQRGPVTGSEPDAEPGKETASEAVPQTAAAGPTSVDARLGTVRRRMKERRAVVAVDDRPSRGWRPWGAPNGPQAASRVARRLLLVVAIVAVSAAASLAVF